MEKIHFLDREGTFSLEQPDDYSYLYFPVAGEQGIKSAVTPNLGGDSKLHQNAFILEPVSVENLHNNRSSRNFWCRIEGKGCWSAVGQSAEAEAAKFTDKQDGSQLTAGLMWHSVTRTSKEYQIRSKVTSFVPAKENVEIMQVEITNIGEENITFSPIGAIPIYGRSADDIRDHRHVTSLLHRIEVINNGITVKPTLSFDERGHQVNKLTYFVCGVTGKGETPVGFYPTVDEFLGEGGTYTRARAVIEGKDGVKPGAVAAGKEAVGAMRFENITLMPQESASFTLFLGATEDKRGIEETFKHLANKELVDNALEETKTYWQNQVNIQYHTGNFAFDNYMRWVSFQPFLRRIYGCSFLPYHDYGKGGRGWRDLWQDCLALLMMNPDGVREMILDNFGGVRMDGSNATIIGEKQGEFIADRNNITRVWMDHGVWPFMTTKLYIDQTGDLALLNEQVGYFKDQQVERGTQKDTEWNEEYGNQQKDVRGSVYKGTILEHLLLQHLCAFYEVGEHNHIRLRGADWNDALDMAEQKGESVAFTCAYAGNLKQLAKYVRLLKRKNKQHHIEILEEIVVLLGNDSYTYDDIDKKLSILKKYEKQCTHEVSGAKISLDAETLAQNLEKKADWMMQHIRKTEWITDEDGDGWFNSYYDNHGRQVEGVTSTGVRMMLTGQVFALMSKVGDATQLEAVKNSTRKYLFDPAIGGYRINTDFKEEKYDMGRMFGFAYGEKENGAVFAHMAVMYANALYQNGFIKEGHEALQALADTSLNFDTSKMYPGIPEYFNNEGRGMYSYLTGAASWYLLTMITEVFGIKGELGDLVLEPKLVASQFDSEGWASIDMEFAGKKLEICYRNPKFKDFGEYNIDKVSLNNGIEENHTDSKVTIKRQDIEQCKDDVVRVTVELV